MPAPTSRARWISAARCTDATMFWYPVHRQRLPPTISSASSSVGSGTTRSPAVIVVRNPGVQKPHWSPWHSVKACCTADRVPSGSARPSTVVISAPSALTASSRQERTGTPSSRIVQAPQTPCSHPTCVPVRPRSWRMQSDSSRRAGTRAVRAAPFTVRLTSCSSSLMPVIRWSFPLAGAAWPQPAPGSAPAGSGRRRHGAGSRPWRECHPPGRPARGPARRRPAPPAGPRPR